MMLFRWFLSSGVRQACAVRKHYVRSLAANRDLLTAEAIASVQLKITELTAAIHEGHAGRINIKAEELQFAAEKVIKPYPNPTWRENIEVLLVALAVAMAIRTFFIQPFKIPTGSMQPTLFGVTSQNLINQPNFQLPTGWARFKEWVQGNGYVRVVAEADGQIDSVSPVKRFLIFSLWQEFTIGGVKHTMWFPPDFGEGQRLPDGSVMDPFVFRAQLYLDPQRVYRKGEEVVKLRMSAGDHLFVDRLTYNFRAPERGETIVFATAGTQIEAQDQFYIKRLTVLPGERVSIGNDRHMRINGERLDASTPHFANVYGFNPDVPPADSRYSGHLNGTVAETYRIPAGRGVAPLFPDEQTVFTNSGKTFMVFGDNTCNSSDSRSWGTVPAENVIGKACFVYWPITSRFGIGATSN